MSPELSRILGGILGGNWVHPDDRERIFSAAQGLDDYDDLPDTIRTLLEEIATRGPVPPMDSKPTLGGAA